MPSLRTYRSMKSTGHALMSCLALGAICMLWPPVALADDLADCIQRSDMPRAVSGCTNLLEARATPQDQRITAYQNRSSAYGALGDFERAEQDYHRAVALHPEYADASRHEGR